MKRTIFLSLVFIISCISIAAEEHKEVYLLTCAPGSESYSIYGHSALRIVDSTINFDKVYNWGVFDFDTPNFVLKFARGRLDYMLAVYSYNSFLREYFSEERTVYSQLINMDSTEIARLELLLEENLKEENLYYRYDFLHDNCATRIKDILEDVYDVSLKYPDENQDDLSTFRLRLGEYQGDLPWLDAGVNLLVGSPGDNNCGFNESMFLPDYLMWNLSRARIEKGNTIVMLLEPATTVFEFPGEERHIRLVYQPWFILSLLSLVIIISGLIIRKTKFHNSIDFSIFSILAILSVLLIFLNFFSDHDAMSRNINLVWLNPLVIVAPFFLLKRKCRVLWLLMVLLVIAYFTLLLLGLQSMNPAIYPLLVLIAARAIYRYRKV